MLHFATHQLLQSTLAFELKHSHRDKGYYSRATSQLNKLQSKLENMPELNTEKTFQ